MHMDDYIDELIAGSVVTPPELTTSSEPTTSSEVWGIVGYRNYTDYPEFCGCMEQLVKKYGKPRMGTSGGAPGADAMAKRWCLELGIPFREHPPKSMTARDLLARNELIVADSTRVVAFLSSKSRGTKHTIGLAKKAGKPVELIRID
jgi:predicted Rossmann fold nucleotide-binding protein DprA/Smf involved in DNA uptake